MPLSNEDELALIRLQARYAQAVSQHDADAYASLFTIDAVWERKQPAKGTKYDREMRIEGREALRQQLAEYPMGLATQYITSNSVLDGDGHHASGCATILVIEVHAGTPTIIVTGNCEDEFKKTADGWKFSYRGISLLS